MKSRSPQRGAVLIVTLVMLCLITILVVGFAISMRFDLDSSASHLDRIEAEIYARMGLDVAQTELANALAPSSAVPSAFWATRPGEIMEVTNGVTYFRTLSSGTPALGFSSNAAVNLNPPSFSGNGMGLITSTNCSILASWLYVTQNGTYMNALPAYNAANPVVGRFAYWVDDESAKVNLNTAWTRAATNSLATNVADPSRVELANLLILSQSDANAIQATRSAAPNQSFNSLQDARRAGGNITNALATNPFSFTAYNHSPADNGELSMIGTPRLILTTQAANAGGGTNYLNILTTPNTDPGYLANINTANYAAAVNQIYGYLTNTSWPIAPGQSFATKYFPNNPARATQLALDIVEYVRCAESTNPCVEPIRGDLSGNSFVYDAAAGLPTSFFGNVRGPRLTEIGAYFSPPYAPQITNYVYVVCEIYLPKNCGLPTLDLSTISVSVAGELSTTATSGIVSSAHPSSAPSGTLGSGQYTITTAKGQFNSSPTSIPASQPAYLNLRVALNDNIGSGNVLDLCPMVNSGIGVPSGLISYAFGSLSAQTSVNTLPSVATEDPSLDKANQYWKYQANNTFTSSNPSGLGQPPGSYSPAATPQQDTDANGNVTDIGICFPAPKGSASNPYGIVHSLGELGFIHSGLNCCTTNSGTPWRTIRLQPQTSGSTALPDWLLLDLFDVPVAPQNTNSFVEPNVVVSGTTTNVFSWGGRVSVNGVHFTDQYGNPSQGDPNPAQALFMGATNTTGANTPSQAALIATNIVNHVLANSNGNAGINWGTGDATNFYFSPGQLAEIQGVSDGGEACEATLRDIFSVTAVRGNVFSIYTVGQALKQDAQGNLHVLSEQRFQNVVERRKALSGTAAQVFFQPVYTRSLTP
jgi:hypothetical protein